MYRYAGIINFGVSIKLNKVVNPLFVACIIVNLAILFLIPHTQVLRARIRF